METGDDKDLLVANDVKDSVGELADQGATNVSVHFWVLRRPLCQRREHSLYSIEKLTSQAIPTLFVPIAGLDDVGLCSGTEDDL